MLFCAGGKRIKSKIKALKGCVQPPGRSLEICSSQLCDMLMQYVAFACLACNCINFGLLGGVSLIAAVVTVAVHVDNLSGPVL